MKESELCELLKIKDELGWYNPTGRSEDIVFMCKKIMDIIDIIVKEDPLSKRELVEQMQINKTQKGESSKY